MEDVFRLRLQHLEERAQAVGGMTLLCEAVGASPYTPRRWRSKTPYTILLVDKLEEALAEREREVARQRRQAASTIERKQKQLSALRETLLEDPDGPGAGRLMRRIDKLHRELADPDDDPTS